MPFRVGHDAPPKHWEHTQSMSHVESPVCALRIAAGSHPEACSSARCPFWEPGGAVLPGGCVIEHLGVELRTPGLAGFLLETRERLERARDAAETAALRDERSVHIGLGF
jgi:hypothetical protein